MKRYRIFTILVIIVFLPSSTIARAIPI